MTASYIELAQRFNALSLDEQSQLLLSNRKAVQEFDPIFWEELQEAKRESTPRKGKAIEQQEPQPQPEPEPMEVIEAPTSNGSTPPVVEEPKPKRKRERRPSDQCPKRLEARLDGLIWDVLHIDLKEPIPAPPAPEPVELQWERTHGEASAAPPSPMGAGEQSADATAISGGADGFPLRNSAWDVVANRANGATDLRDFLQEIEECPSFRAAATLQALSRIREALQQVDEMADVETPVEVHLQDLMLLSRQLLSRLR